MKRRYSGKFILTVSTNGEERIATIEEALLNSMKMLQPQLARWRLTIGGLMESASDSKKFGKSYYRKIGAYRPR